MKYGIKGFDKNLQCRGFQFEIGKTYTIEEKPELCARGFHYCDNVMDIDGHYKIGGQGNRFCIVGIPKDAEVAKGTDKNATNKITIIKEITNIDKKGSINSNIVQFLSDKGFYIGGSYALRKFGFKIDRPESNELDLVPSDKADFSVLDVYEKKNRKNSGIDSEKLYVGLLGEKYDVLRNYKDFNVIVKDGVNYVDPAYIWKAKLKYALEGSKKHQKDIKDNNIIFEMVEKPKMGDIKINSIIDCL